MKSLIVLVALLGVIIVDAYAMDVHIRMANGTTHTFTVEQSDLIINLKEQIEFRLNIPVVNQELQFNGNQLDNNRALADYNIQRGAVLELSIVNIDASLGQYWAAAEAATPNAWQSIAYGNGLFVAVANSGTGNRVMTSPDGINWTSRASAVDNNWVFVTYGNGLFVALSTNGSGNRVMTSPDGINWTSRTSASNNIWRSVTYANGLFVAVSITGSGNRVMTSPDGITWTSRASAADNSWNYVTYGNGKFVAVAYSGEGNRVMTSPDGITWTSRASAVNNQWRSVAYGNGLFVAVANTGTGNQVMTSPDGITWTSQTSTPDNQSLSISYGDGKFIAVGLGSRVMYSVDGVTWTTANASSFARWNSVIYGNGKFVAVTSDADNLVMLTTDSPLAVTSSTPANNATKVSLTDSLVVRFSREITLMDASLIRLNDGSKNIAPEFVRVREDSLIVGPSGFINGVTYTLTIGAGAVEDNNEKPNEQEVISFRTIKAAPVPVAFIPDDGAVLVPLDAVISVKFNKRLQQYSQESSITADVVVNEIRYSNQTVTLQDSTATVVFDASNFVKSATVTVEFKADGAFIANEDDVLIEPLSWSFTMFLDMPAQVSGFSPNDGQGSVSILPELTWESADYADSYELQYKSAPDQVFMTVANLATAAYTLEDTLDYYQSVFWQVRGVNAAGAGAWSILNQFYTEAERPVPGFPSDNATGISIAPRMQWSSKHTETTYQIVMATDDELTQVIIDSLLAEQVLPLEGLDSDKQYFWKVRVSDEFTSSAWSEIKSFRTRPAPGSESAGGDRELVFSLAGVQNSKAPQQIEYRMLSFPGNQEMHVSDVFEGEMGKDWIAWYDDGSDDDFFVEYNPDNPNFRFRAGNGFWIMSLAARKYEMEYNSVMVNNQDNYPIELRAGWNVISSPFNTTIPWEQVQIVNNITAPIYGYDGSYTTSENMEPFHAYYFFNDTANLIEILQIPYVSADSRGLANSESLSKKTTSKMPRADLNVQFTSDNQRYDQQVSLLFPENTDGFYNQAIPRSQKGQVGLSFIHGESSRTGWRQLIDVYDYQGLAYELEVNSIVGSEIIWNVDLNHLPDHARVLLINTVSMESHLLGDGESAQVQISSPSVIYTMYVGDQAYLEGIQDNLLPDAITLEPNYPNPFNPVTNIRYALPDEQQVRLEVFDVLGRRVQLFHSGVQSAGWHMVQFDGSRLASGVYIYRLQTTDQIITGKMMLIK